MPSFEFLCLANSKKLSHRCIAGLRTDTGEWIRPVSSSLHGELTHSQRNLGTAGDPQNFDTLRVSFANHAPTASQRENLLIDGTAWQLVSRPAPTRLHTVLGGAIHGSAKLFGSLSDHIPEATFSSHPAKESLALVKPAGLRWLTDSYGPHKKARALFSTAGAAYNLAVTDPIYQSRIKSLQLGYHKSTELGIEDEERILFTISLGEPFEGNCYKLVAAVLMLPVGWPSIR